MADRVTDLFLSRLILLVASILFLLVPAIQGNQHQQTQLPNTSHQSWLKWGPYRPNLYFGIRPQVPETLLMGLMWANGESRSSMLQSLRDTCEQDDGMEGYGWTKYDTRTGGTQVFHDSQLNINLSTQFLKGSDGESWSVRVSGTPRSGALAGKALKTALIFHLALEKASGDASNKSLECHTNDNLQDTAVCTGHDPALGDFQLRVQVPGNGPEVEGPFVRNLAISESQIWQAKSVFTNNAADMFDARPMGGSGTMQFIGLKASAPFSFDIHYFPDGSTSNTGTQFAQNLEDFEGSLPGRVDNVFPRLSPFDGLDYQSFTMSLLSNLLGGLGFFHGDSKVDDSHHPAYQETDLRFWESAAAAMGKAKVKMAPPAALLSLTPSRPFFPRGFLWDDGFHLLPVVEWDLDLAIAVLKSWLELMDEDGWIAREQILGPEARSKVPEKFQVQYPHYANPPTLLLLVPLIVSKLKGSSPYRGNPSEYLKSEAAATALLGDIYPLLSRHYNWWRRTQAGNFTDTYPRPNSAVGNEGYRWRGRTPTHILTSGIDDYPRADPPHPGELHVDALSWVAVAAEAMHTLAQHLDKREDAAAYLEQSKHCRQNLDILHWEPSSKAYCDATVRNNEYERVCHLGYISLLPFFLGLVEPNDPRLPDVLDLLSDPKGVWSPHGLRSLSAQDPNYSRDEDYWRGAVWMNLNVLAVQQLSALAKQHGPEQARAGRLAEELRRNVIGTVYESWRETGFVWEQYSDTTGEGRRSRAFTGWTACVLLLMGLDTSASGRDSGVGSGSTLQPRGGMGWLSTPSMVGLVGVMVVLVFMRKKVLGILRKGLETAKRRRWID